MFLFAICFTKTVVFQKCFESLNEIITTMVIRPFYDPTYFVLSLVTDLARVLGMTLNCLHRVIALLHPGTNDLSTVEVQLNNNYLSLI